MHRMILQARSRLNISFFVKLYCFGGMKYPKDTSVLWQQYKPLLSVIQYLIAGYCVSFSYDLFVIKVIW